MIHNVWTVYVALLEGSWLTCGLALGMAWLLIATVLLFVVGPILGRLNG